MKGPMIISERNLSVAWGKAFLAVYDAVEVAPLVVVIDDYPGGEPIEVASIREALDEELKAQGQGSCHTVASTMFPKSMWNPEASRGELFDRYLTIYPRLRKMHKANRNGMYFQRLIAFGSDNNGAGGFNQLDHVLTTWEGGNHRRTALQVALLDPLKDHTHQRQRGFPCLQQVSFAPTGKDGLAVTGFYATQYIVERAYGNYLGLGWLGQFMAHEMGLKLERMTCVAAPAVRNRSKARLEPLARRIRASTEHLLVGASHG